MHTKTSKQTGLDAYFSRITKFSALTKKETAELCYKVENENDSKAKHKLLISNLRLVVFIVKKEFKWYGMPHEDLIQEGNIGLIEAIKNYDSSIGTKFSAYIGLCIKWKIYTYVLKNFKQINLGRSTLHVKLFFKLRKMKAKIHLPVKEELEYVANAIGVSIQEIEKMEEALYGKYYSYSTVETPYEEDSEYSIDMAKPLLSNNKNPAEIVETEEYQSYVIDALVKRLNKMPAMERDIIMSRYFVDKPMTLEALGKYYKLSRERIRQIEKPAFEILKKLANDLTEKM